MRKIPPIFALLFLFLATPVLSQAQRKIIDSLLTVLKHAKDDTTRSNSMNNLSSYYRVFGDYEDSKKFAENALALSEKINFRKGIAVAHYNIGCIQDNQGNSAEALKSYQKSLKISEEIDHKKAAAYCYNNIGILYDKQGNYKQSLYNYSAALKIEEEINDKYGMGNTYIGIGNVYMHQGFYYEALATLGKALTIGKEMNNMNTIAYTYGNMGVAYQNLGNYTEALNNYFKSLKISEIIGAKNSIGVGYNQIGVVYLKMGNKKEALNYFNSSLKISKELKDIDGISDTYCNIGGIYLDDGNYSEAKKYFLESKKIIEQTGDKAGLASTLSNIGRIYREENNYEEALKNHYMCVAITKQIGDQHGLAVSYNNVADIHIKQNKFETAKKYLDSAFVLSKKIGSKETLRNTFAANSHLDSLTGNFKGAYANYKLARLYEDSLINKENAEKMVQLRMEYEFGKKEDSLRYHQEITDEKLKQQTLLARQQQQMLLLNAKELALVNKEKDIQRLEYFKTQAELQAEQSKRKENEDQLVIAEQQKSLQQTKLDLQASQLGLQNKELQAKKTQRNIFIAGTIALLLLAFFIFRNFQIQRKANKLIKIAAEKERIELQLQSLRAQLNPHFMFNSLNAIQELIVMEENEKSQSYLERFAKLLRMLLENANEPFIPLRKEINFLELYLSLEKLRLPDLQYNIEIDPQVDPQKVMTPNMMLQPYVENALWHGLQHKQGNKKLTLHIGRQNGSLEYQIKDNGVGRKKAEDMKSLYRKEHRSKGMELLNQRFTLLSREYGKNIETSVTDLTENGDASGTLVKISVPYSVASNEKTSA